jgi:hypothetical protein
LYGRSHLPSSHSSFCEEVFPRSEPDWHLPEPVAAIGEPKTGSSVTLANEVDRTNILAPGLWSGTRRTPLLPAFTGESGIGILPMIHGLEGHATTSPIGSWEVVSSYSSATAPDSHGISCADPRLEPTDRLFKLTKNYLALQDSVLGWLIAACTPSLKTYLIQRLNIISLCLCLILPFIF